MRSLSGKNFLKPSALSILTLILCLSFSCVVSMGYEENEKAWVLVDKVPLRKEPRHASKCLNMLNYGQAVKIIEEKDNWVKVRLFDEPYCKSDGSESAEDTDKDCILEPGWLEKSSLLNRQIDIPQPGGISFEAFSPAYKGGSSEDDEKYEKAWLNAENVPLRKEPKYITDWLCLLNYGQAVRIMQERNNWVEVRLIDEPSWQIVESQWVEVYDHDCLSRSGWLEKTSLLNKKPEKPKRGGISFKAFSPDSIGKKSEPPD